MNRVETVAATVLYLVALAAAPVAEAADKVLTASGHLYGASALPEPATALSFAMGLMGLLVGLGTRRRSATCP